MNNRITKTMRAKAGFTLVELIVVIAILGILAGVGTVGYSGYIKKANMAADEQLIAEVKNALEIGRYSFDMPDGIQYVTISADRTKDTIASNGFADECMKATFGDNYSSLYLRSSEWKDGGLLALAANQQYAEMVNQSSYLQNSTVPELLDNVKTVTTAASEFLSAQGDAPAMYTKLKMALGDENFENILKAANLETVETASGTALDSSVTNTQISNLMVLCVAQELSEIDTEQIPNLILDPDAAPSVSLATQMAVEYAAIKAYALKSEEGIMRFNNMNEAMKTATTMSELRTAFSLFSQGADESFTAGYASYLISSDYQNDMKAFGSIMEAVDSVSGDYLDAATLNNTDLYTSASVANQMNTYIDATTMDDMTKQALSADGSVSVCITKDGSATAIAYIE